MGNQLLWVTVQSSVHKCTYPRTQGTRVSGIEYRTWQRWGWEDYNMEIWKQQVNNSQKASGVVLSSRSCLVLSYITRKHILNVLGQGVGDTWSLRMCSNRVWFSSIYSHIHSPAGAFPPKSARTISVSNPLHGKYPLPPKYYSYRFFPAFCDNQTSFSHNSRNSHHAWNVR